MADGIKTNSDLPNMSNQKDGAVKDKAASKKKRALTRIKDSIKAVASKIKSGMTTLATKIKSPFCRKTDDAKKTADTKPALFSRTKTKVANMGKAIANKGYALWNAITRHKKKNNEEQDLVHDNDKILMRDEDYTEEY